MIDGQNQRNPKVLGSTPVPANRRVISTTSPEDRATIASVDSSCAVRAIGSTSRAIPLAEPAPKTAKPPVLEAQDRRVGNGAESLRGHIAKDARLQLKNVRAANDVFSLCAPAGQGELMPELRGVAYDAVIARHQRKPAQPPIERTQILRQVASSLGSMERSVSYLRVRVGPVEAVAIGGAAKAADRVGEVWFRQILG